jgi:drug/metabolite transporter (DMT)-like permease
MIHKKFLPHIYLLTANLIYGVSFTIAKDVVPQYVQPFAAIILRVSISMVLFFACYFLFVKEKIMKQDLLLLFTCGIFGVAINQLLFFKGLSITTPINAALIMTTTPILVVIISVILGKDYINWKRVLGIIIGICGAITVITFGKSINYDTTRWMGDLFIFLNAVSYAIYIVIVKPLMRKYHPITVITMVFFFGWFIVVPVGFNQLLLVEWHSIPTLVYWELAFIIIATTFFAYLFNILAMKSASPSVVGIYIYSQPAIASIFALLMNKDVFSWEKIVATILIFIGVYLVSFAGKKKSIEIQSVQE